MTKILIIDDHNLFTEGIRLLLEQAAPELEVLCANNAKQSLDIIKYKNIDLLLIDLEMPETSGLSFIQQLEKEKQHIPFAILSASTEQREIQEAFSLGASGFMSKSSSGKQIITAIDDMLSGHTVKLLPEPQIVTENLYTPRQIEILNLLCDGYSNKEIARALGVSAETIKSHLKNIFLKMNTSTRSECVKKAITEKLI